MKIYFDSCCYNRPFDDDSQDRIKLESDSILAIAARAYLSDSEIVGSAALIMELSNISDEVRKENVAAMYRIATGYVKRDETVIERALQLQKEGMHPMDSMHVALAEKAQAVFLTVDDKLLKICNRLKIKAMNPIDFLKEVIQNES